MSLKNIPLLVLFCSLGILARAQDDPPQRFRLGADLVTHGAFASGGTAFSPGVGASAFAEWRPLDALSFGSGFSFSYHPDTPSWSLASWDMGGRIYPLGATPAGEWYLQGTAGLDVVTASLKDKWPGSFHGTAGLGYRFFSGPRNALDLGVQYELFSPLHDPLQAVGVKIGWVFLFGPPPTGAEPSAPQKIAAPQTAPKVPAQILSAPPKVTKKKRPKPKMVTREAPEPTATPDPNGPLVYSWAEGDNLSSIAEAYYGDQNLFPILVDANKGALGSPDALVKGVEILVPQHLSEAQKASARQKVDGLEYAPWKRVGQKPSGLFGN